MTSRCLVASQSLKMQQSLVWAILTAGVYVASDVMLADHMFKFV